MFWRFSQPKEFPFSDQFKFLKTIFEVIIILQSPKFRHLKISCQHSVVHHLTGESFTVLSRDQKF